MPYVPCERRPVTHSRFTVKGCLIHGRYTSTHQIYLTASDAEILGVSCTRNLPLIGLKPHLPTENLVLWTYPIHGTRTTPPGSRQRLQFTNRHSYVPGNNEAERVCCGGTAAKRGFKNTAADVPRCAKSGLQTGNKSIADASYAAA